MSGCPHGGIVERCSLCFVDSMASRLAADLTAARADLARMRGERDEARVRAENVYAAKELLVAERDALRDRCAELEARCEGYRVMDAATTATLITQEAVRDALRDQLAVCVNAIHAILIELHNTNTSLESVVKGIAQRALARVNR